MEMSWNWFNHWKDVTPLRNPQFPPVIDLSSGSNTRVTGLLYL